MEGCLNILFSPPPPQDLLDAQLSPACAAEEERIALKDTEHVEQAFTSDPKGRLLRAMLLRLQVCKAIMV